MFQISLHEKDAFLLHRLKDFFGVGKVINRKDDVFYYNVSNFEDLNVIIYHFDKYPLVTEKWVDFELFKKVVDIINKNHHLTTEGLQQIVNIKASMNFENLSEKLWASFPNTKPITKPVINKNDKVINLEWLRGFVDGEGCFTINIYSRKDTVLGKGVKLVFKITQKNRNRDVLEKIIKLFDCGKIYNNSKANKSDVIDFMVTGFSDIIEKIKPFFLTHPPDRKSVV